jgi:Gpi18-like mannosyltransferase
MDVLNSKINTDWHRLEVFLTGKRGRILAVFLISLTIGLAIYARMRGLFVVTDDVESFLYRWYDFLAFGKGFATPIGTSFSNVAPAYLYFLYLATRFPEIPKVIAIKFFSLVFDGICILAVYKIARIFQGKVLSWIAAIGAALAPTVWLNSAWWGQNDSILGGFILLCVYFLLKNKPLWGLVMFALAFSFKFQAIFLAPFLLLLFIIQRIHWKWIIIPPLVYIASIIPASLAGQPFFSLLTIYFRQSGLAPSVLTLSAPNLFAFFPDNGMIQYGWIGFALSGFGLLVYLWLAWKEKEWLTHERMMELIMISLIVLPFLFPRMHERYFYLAALFSIVLVFARPRLLVIPFVLQFTSLLSYFSYFSLKEIIPLWMLACLNLLVIIALTFYWRTQNRTLETAILIGFDSKTTG